MAGRMTPIRRADEEGALSEAAALLKQGGLVAFPTETVYGLGAVARMEEAVARLYRVKGRPPTNPVIVHVASAEEARRWVRHWTPAAQVLAEAFWPGPLTLVLEAAQWVPAVVRGGQPTVALRCPRHPVALALLREVGEPLVAPSANRSGRPSPTRAQEVWEDFPSGEIDLILDGGPVEVGVESTVVDAREDTLHILRPGGVTVEDLKAVWPGVEAEPPEQRKKASPGSRFRHYAPRVPVRLFGGEGGFQSLLKALRRHPRRGLLAPTEILRAVEAEGCRPEAVFDAGPLSDPSAYARRLYEGLRTLEKKDIEEIYAWVPEEEGLGLAVRDRLARAAAGSSGESVLFVCSGNTCRSPLAEAIWRKLGEEEGLPLAVGSAGLFALEGRPASASAQAVAKERGLDLSGHRSRPFDPSLLEAYDLIITMEGWQADELRRQHPEAKGKIFSWREIFGGGDVLDPYGSGPDAYRATLDRLEADLRRWWEEKRGRGE
ncbi:MAG: threonylcarbamoyl-AMP synthase [Clostridiales bacterium]|nr:threonylcarbamoyl-AMP synthase [Clostridiales bacterium]